MTSPPAAQLPAFRYHPDPIGSGSIVASTATCRCCGQSRGYIYAGQPYATETLEDCLCPWCISDGSAHKKYDAAFVDSEAFPERTPEEAIDEITERTPGFSSWQSEQWPLCCGDATAFLTPAGIKEIRDKYREAEGTILNHIIYDMEISGGAATRLLGSLDRDAGPTAYLFRCLHCEQIHCYIDQP
jgi:uncharacterized protein CbrC (UPF0167 family)